MLDPVPGSETLIAGILFYYFNASFFVLKINTALSAASQRPMCWGIMGIEPSIKNRTKFNGKLTFWKKVL
jgi:hypothetical protein